MKTFRPKWRSFSHPGNCQGSTPHRTSLGGTLTGWRLWCLHPRPKTTRVLLYPRYGLGVVSIDWWLPRSHNKPEPILGAWWPTLTVNQDTDRAMVYWLGIVDCCCCLFIGDPLWWSPLSPVADLGNLLRCIHPSPFPGILILSIIQSVEMGVWISADSEPDTTKIMSKHPMKMTILCKRWGLIDHNTKSIRYGPVIFHIQP